MHKEKDYRWARFSEDVIREAAKVFRDQVLLPIGEEESHRFTVTVDEADWSHDSEEEFFADYRRSGGHATYSIKPRRSGAELRVWAFQGFSRVLVEAPTRAQVEAVFSVFEQGLDKCRLPAPEEPPPPPPTPPTIFIGHGRNQLWRDLKDHLHEKHGFRVEAYEIGSRAGHAVRDVLEEMLERSSFALLVMTGEDETAEGNLRARQNVVHEAGLFQGRLGFSRAVVVLEEGTEEFSNIQGIEQIRFSKGNIKETFGDVVATIRREFPE